MSSIISFSITIGLNIGTCKLYQKLGLSRYIVIFTFIYPLLTIMTNWFSGTLETIFTIVAGILAIITLFQYFKSVGMSGLWGIAPVVSIVLLGMGIPYLILGIGGILGMLSFIGIVMLIASLIAYIISNVKLAKLFGKGTGFTIGLAILPFIFQPILGYSRAEKIMS